MTGDTATGAAQGEGSVPLRIFLQHRGAAKHKGVSTQGGLFLQFNQQHHGDGGGLRLRQGHLHQV